MDSKMLLPSPATAMTQAFRVQRTTVVTAATRAERERFMPTMLRPDRAPDRPSRGVMPDDPAPTYALDMALPVNGRARAWVAACLLLGVALTALVDADLGGGLVGGPVVTLATVVSAYLVGAWMPPVLATLTSLAAAAILTAANQVADPGRYTAANDLFFFAVLVGCVALAGNLVTARAAQVRELRALSAVREEQRTRELEAARLEERTRVDAGVTRAMMQRMSALVVQASGVRREHASIRDREAVARVESGGRETLEELREVLGSLDSPLEKPTARAEEPTTPARREPGLGWVDVLVGCSGIPVAVECVATSASRVRRSPTSSPAWPSAFPWSGAAPTR